MNESTLLKKRNKIKAIGSSAAILAAISNLDASSLMNDGPGVLTGFFVLLMFSCVIYLAKTKG